MGKRVYIFSDSIAKGIRKKEFNSLLRNHHATLYDFPGATAKQLAYHMKPYITEDTPDVVIIHVGTNDVTKTSKSQQSAQQIANDIIYIGENCKQNGVNDVMLSSITCRRNFPLNRKSIEINSILREMCKELCL